MLNIFIKTFIFIFFIFSPIYSFEIKWVVDGLDEPESAVFDKNNSELDFEKRFSFYFDYPGNAQLIGSQLETALDEIFERITQDIFNSSLANW